MNHFLPLCTLIYALCALTVSAIVDTNGNGFSDLWERTFNNGELLPSDFDPQADPDHDGLANAQEAAAGISPFDPNPPAGCVRPQITHMNNAWLDLDGDGLDEFYVEVESVAWPTLPGKQYTLQCSIDLAIGSWLPVESATANFEGVRTYYFPLTQTDSTDLPPEHLFWRIAIEDVDSDGDGLTDAEEYALGTNPNLADSDGDGLNDFDEVTLGTSPTNSDSDGDGVSDADEVANGTNPLSDLDADNDGIPDDFEKFLAKQFLEYQPDEAAWGTYYAGLIIGDLDPNHAYTDDNMPMLELANILRRMAAAGAYNPDPSMLDSGGSALRAASATMSSASAASTGSPSTKFMVESMYRRNKLYGWNPTNPLHHFSGSYWYSEPYGYDYGIDLTSLDDLTPDYLVSNIDSVEWGYSSIPNLMTWIPGYSLPSSAKSDFYVDPNYGSGTTMYYGFLEQSKSRIMASRFPHEPLNAQFLKITSKRSHTQYEVYGNWSTCATEPFLIQIPKGKFLSDWVETKAPMESGQDTQISYVPVEVAVKKKMDSDPPIDGMIAKVNDIIEFKISDISQENFPIAAQNIKWFQKQLLADGTYADWCDIGQDARGVKFEHSYDNGGIFQIKCEITANDHTIVFNYVRKQDNIMSRYDPDDASETLQTEMKEGALDAIGVCDSQKKIDIRYNAKINLNSTYYAVGNDIYPVGPGFHCNIFVAHKAGDAAATVPWFNGTFPHSYPPVANQWAGVPPDPDNGYPAYEYHFSDWPLLASDSYPQPGMVAGKGFYTWSTGHCGIVDYDGQWISASGSKVQRHTSFVIGRNTDLFGNRLPAGKRKYIGN